MAAIEFQAFDDKRKIFFRYDKIFRRKPKALEVELTVSLLRATQLFLQAERGGIGRIGAHPRAKLSEFSCAR